MTRARLSLGCLLLLCFFAGTIGFLAETSAQETAPPKRFADIPKDAIGVFSLDLSGLRSHQDFQLWPWEILDIAAQEQLGLDLSKIEAIDGMMLMPSPEPELGISIRTKTPVDIAEFPAELFKPVEGSPKDPAWRFREFIQNPMMRMVQREPTRILVGTQGAIRRMTSMRLQSGGEFVGMVEQSPAMLKLALNLESLRDLTSAFAMSNEYLIPPEMSEEIEQAIDLANDAMLEMFQPERSNALSISLGTSGQDKAELLSKSLLRIRQQLMESYSDFISQEMSHSGSLSEQMQQAMVAYMNRVRTKMDSDSFWEIKKDRLIVNLDNSIISNYQVVGALVGNLLPAFQLPRQSPLFMESTNNLKQIMLAMHNYHDSYNGFPARAIVDADKKPLLSWRVTILPFLGYDRLYQEFHFDEPWDSPHNIKLLERMPSVFRNPMNPAVKGTTTYMVPVGEGVGLGVDGIGIRKITDGTSNTIAVLDVDPKFGVPWTKPDDFDIKLMAESTWIRQEGSSVGFFDGSVRNLPLISDLELLEALMTHSGGETVPVIP